MSTRLSVNINKIATLRNARGGNLPNVIQFAKDCERYGAQGITIHPRPDERHITTRDVYDLAEVVTTEFNIEGYPDDRFMRLVEETRPAQATLVPDPPHVLTSNAGWNTEEQFEFLKSVIGQIQNWGVRVSIFMEPNMRMLKLASDLGTDRIEFYTGPYAEQFSANRQDAVNPFAKASEYAHSLKLGINAGHDLNLDNLKYFVTQLPHLEEVSIGHALISDALYYGIEKTIEKYLEELVRAVGI